MWLKVAVPTLADDTRGCTTIFRPWSTAYVEDLVRTKLAFVRDRPKIHFEVSALSRVKSTRRRDDADFGREEIGYAFPSRFSSLNTL